MDCARRSMVQGEEGSPSMKHYAGSIALIALAFSAKFALRPLGLGFDIHIHDSLRVIPVSIVVFWLLMGVATAWFLMVVRSQISAQNRPDQ